MYMSHVDCDSMLPINQSGHLLQGFTSEVFLNSVYIYLLYDYVDLLYGIFIIYKE